MEAEREGGLQYEGSGSDMNLRRVLEGGEGNKMRACVLAAWKGGRGRGRVGWKLRDGRFKPKESGG